MDMQKDINYRLALAQGFLQEAEDSYTTQHWRACVSSAILVIENAGLAVLMLFGVSPMTHKPGMHLKHLVSEGTLHADLAELIAQLLPYLEQYDSHEKMLAKYGDETTYELPWQLYDAAKATTALDAARNAVRISTTMAERGV
uniref:HEPN domain-containing protein n=1 Tax=Chlorobium chlorochromatii (strain CaD3) TaxID=340177 RepID=Q3AQ36_CHLCH